MSGRPEPVTAADEAIATVAEENQGDPWISHTYRKEKGGAVSISLIGGAAIDITARQVARLIELSVKRRGRSARPG